MELREGFFNISAAVMGRETTDADERGRTYAPRYALNDDGDACSFTAAVSHLPGNCDAAEDSITVDAVTGADSDGRVIVTFDVGCEADDGDGSGNGGGDGGGDVQDRGEDGADAIGPPEDTPTG